MLPRGKPEQNLKTWIKREALFDSFTETGALKEWKSVKHAMVPFWMPYTPNLLEYLEQAKATSAC